MCSVEWTVTKSIVLFCFFFLNKNMKSNSCVSNSHLRPTACSQLYNIGIGRVWYIVYWRFLHPPFHLKDTFFHYMSFNVSAKNDNSIFRTSSLLVAYLWQTSQLVRCQVCFSYHFILTSISFHVIHFLIISSAITHYLRYKTVLTKLLIIENTTSYSINIIVNVIKLLIHIT